MEYPRLISSGNHCQNTTQNTSNLKNVIILISVKKVNWAVFYFTLLHEKIYLIFTRVVLSYAMLCDNRHKRTAATGSSLAVAIVLTKIIKLLRKKVLL